MASAKRKPGDGFFGHKPNHKNGGRPSPGNFLPKQKSGRAEPRSMFVLRFFS
jgi:hypothetical protein